MRNRNADVFIEMESLNLFPVKPFGRGECVKKLKLRRAGRQDDPAAVALGNRSSDRSGSLLRRRLSQSGRILEDFYEHWEISAISRELYRPSAGVFFRAMKVRC